MSRNTLKNSDMSYIYRTIFWLTKIFNIVVVIELYHSSIAYLNIFIDATILTKSVNMSQYFLSNLVAQYY